MADFPSPRRVELTPHCVVDGANAPPITLSVHEAGSGPAVVLCHGFPELAYSWRHQFALAGAGFRVIAPDQRGYGESDRPAAVAAYDIHHLTGDLVGLLDALEIDRAVFAGHDWGGFVAWAMPLLHPERTAGVIGVNTPYLPRMLQPRTELLRPFVGGQDEKLYVLWFQEPGVADPVLAAHTRELFEKLMRGGVPPAEMLARASADGFDLNPFRRLEELEPMGEPIMPAEELDVFIESFERTGFTGGVNWYRNFDRNFATVPGLGTQQVEVPCLMVTAEWDPALRPELASGMPSLVPDLETVMIEKCGHWTQQEKPSELNEILIDWLGRRFATG